MCKVSKLKCAKSYRGRSKFIWLLTPDMKSDLSEHYADVICYNRTLAYKCSVDRISSIVNSVLENEFTSKIKENMYYDLIIYGLTNRLATMQSIKNVLSYKKENNIKEIKDISFNNGEVLLKCLI